MIKPEVHATRHQRPLRQRQVNCLTHPSVKLTQLGLQVDQQVLDSNLDRIASAAEAAGRLLWIDMEGSAWTEPTVAAFRRLHRQHQNIGLCIQAYLHRTPADVMSLLPLKPWIRLVKGAYAEPATQALQSRSEVSAAYRQLPLQLLEETSRGLPPPTLATHDVALLRAISVESGAKKDSFEVAMRYGIRTADLRRLAAEGHRAAVLISYGSEWAAYFLRRLAERPANLVFGLTAIVRR